MSINDNIQDKTTIWIHVPWSIRSLAGDALTLRNDSLYAFKQDYSYSASGGVPIQAPDTPLVPVAILTGSPFIPSCGNVELNGRRSTGSGARALIYEWSVSADSVDDDLLSALSAANGRSDGSLRCICALG